MLFVKVDVFIWLVILCVCFVDHCLCFCPFSFGYYVCLSMTGVNCGTWTAYTPGAYDLTLRFSTFILLNLSFYRVLFVFVLFSIGHCIVYSSTYGLCLLVWYFQTFLIHIIKINIMCILNYTCIMDIMDW
jgi:hypothetical protein